MAEESALLFNLVFTYLLVRLLLVVILIQPQVIAVIALQQPQSQGLSSSGAGGRKRNWERKFTLLLFVTHAHHLKDSGPLLSSRALCLLDLQRKQNS